MSRSNHVVPALMLSVVAAMALAAGCTSSVIGSECRAPYVLCGRYCVDLSSDGLNCGACGSACALGCVNRTCVLPDAAANPDASRLDAGHDAGAPDAGRDASADAGTDAFVSDVGVDANDHDGGGPRCDLGERLCGASCVDPRDATRCGDCTTSCSGTDVCASGACAADCGSRMACGTRCVDATRDPRHCGDCTTDCGSGICVSSACASAPSGHLVYIGHDFEQRRLAMSTVLANAVLLPARSSIRVLAYEGDATALGIAGTRAGLAEGAAGGTPYTLVAASSADALPVELDEADVLLIHAQTGASDAVLLSLGYAWADALASFLGRGGVVVVLDAPSLSNAGTHQLLGAAGLFRATAINEVVSPSLTAVSGRGGDAVLAGVVFPYAGERHTVRVSTLEPDAIVTTGSSPVVFHRVVTP